MRSSIEPISRHIPFAAVDHQHFKDAVVARNLSMKDYLFGRASLRAWAKDEFVAAKAVIKEVLKQVLSKIHISFDIWTSSYSTYAFLGIAAHFVVKEEGKTVTRSMLLALRRMYEGHTGE